MSSEMADSSSTLDETFWGGQEVALDLAPTQVGLPLPPSYPITNLEGHTAHRQVAAVLQEGKVFGHQGSSMYHALGSLCMVAQLCMFASHVLQPRQPQVWRALVPPGNPRVQDSRGMSACPCLSSPTSPAFLLICPSNHPLIAQSWLRPTHPAPLFSTLLLILTALSNSLFLFSFLRQGLI